MTEILQSVVNVLAVCRKWRLAGAQPAKHGQREIE
jgi:hypothetical protein